MLAYAYSLVAHVTADRKGVTAMEYGVIAAGIVLVVATAATTLGNDVSALFNSIAGQL
jgi:pilus assembly protein Flp/PilA